MRQNISVKAISFIFREFILDVLGFPLWWYSVGMFQAFTRLQKTVSSAIENLGLVIWLKNLFVPMYGQYDWQSRIISFFMRFFQIIFRLIALLFFVVFAVIVFLLWLFLPIFIVSQVLLHLGVFNFFLA